MERESILRSAVVASSPKDIRGDEQASLGPPEGSFLPPRLVLDGDEFERRDRLPRNDVELDAQPPCQLGDVTVVTVEQLEHAGRLTRRANTLLDARAVHRINEPDAAVDNQRVRAALHELVHDPAEAGVELVAEGDLQLCHVAA